jgi:hypothetical protein
VGCGCSSVWMLVKRGQGPALVQCQQGGCNGGGSGCLGVLVECGAVWVHRCVDFSGALHVQPGQGPVLVQCQRDGCLTAELFECIVGVLVGCGCSSVWILVKPGQGPALIQCEQGRCIGGLRGYIVGS